jgi:hypothetical protein
MMITQQLIINAHMLYVHATYSTKIDTEGRSCATCTTWSFHFLLKSGMDRSNTRVKGAHPG